MALETKRMCILAGVLLCLGVTVTLSQFCLSPSFLSLPVRAMLLPALYVLVGLLLVAGGIGLMLSRGWSFFIIYLATVLNMTLRFEYSLVPGLDVLLRQWLPTKPVWYLVHYGSNVLFVVALAWLHLAVGHRAKRATGIESTL